MFQNQMKKPTFITGVLLAGSMLAACQPTALSGPTPAEAITRNEVRMVRIPYSIQPEVDGTTTPSSYTLNSLSVFLRSSNVGYGDLILLDTSSVSPERADAVQTFLQDAGLPFGGTMPLGETPPDGSLMVYIERHVVTPPECGIWGPQNHENNNASAHLGCATAANLGMMVANPRDLIMGQSAGNSTAAAVGAIYTPTPQNAGPTMTLSFEGLPESARPTTTPVPATAPTNNR